MVFTGSAPGLVCAAFEVEEARYGTKGSAGGFPGMGLMMLLVLVMVKVMANTPRRGLAGERFGRGRDVCRGMRGRLAGLQWW